MADLTSCHTALCLHLVDIAIKALVDCGSSACCNGHASTHMQLPGNDKRQASMGMQL